MWLSKCHEFLTMIKFSRIFLRILCYVFECWMALLHSLGYFFPSISHYPFLYAQLLMLFHLTQKRFSQSSPLLIYLPLYVYFNTYCKNWLTFSSGTDRPGKLCYIFCISNNLIQIVNFPTHIPNSDFHSPVLLNLFLFLNVVFIL